MTTTDATKHQADPYQYESARAAGSQDVVRDEAHVAVSGMAVERYAQQDYSAGQRAIAKAHLNVGRNERVASLIGGVALALYGARKQTPGALALAAAGGALIYRGASGHCPLNSALGRNSARP